MKSKSSLLRKFRESTKDSKDSKDPKRSSHVDVDSLIPTPCIHFNLECSGHIEGAFHLGKVTNLIGDSHTGKTLFALSMLAESAQLKRFKDYRLIYDDAENALEFDMEYMFGKDASEHIDTETFQSNTIEDLSDNINGLLSEEVPFIYILDSFDSISDVSELEHEADNRKKRMENKKTTGTYGMEKPKAFGKLCREIKSKLKKNKSALIIISQTRDNVGFGAQFTPRYRSGGRALKFYSCHEVWISVVKNEKKGNRVFKTTVRAKITKNKLTGRNGEAEFSMLFDYGIDYVSSCVDFLIREKAWKISGKTVDTNGFIEEDLKYSDVVKYIENKNLEKPLALLCKDIYDKIIDNLKPAQRKRRYI